MYKKNLNKEEKDILKDFELGKFKSVRNVKNKKEEYLQHARFTLSKTRNINIRISEKDFRKVKALAAERGLPYQTFISSLLHQYSNKKKKEVLF